MRPIGFSTGALAYGDFRTALSMLRGKPVGAIELSALREGELYSILDVLNELNLSQFQYISFHAPSRFLQEDEAKIVNRLSALRKRRWPIILHPDACHDYTLWRTFGSQLCIENSDRRKPIGRNVSELQKIFAQLPDASFCFDFGHARQVDSTMSEAYSMLKTFQSRLRQVHVSDVNVSSRHAPLSYAATLAFREVAPLVPEDVPVILETPVGEGQIESEMQQAMFALPTSHHTYAIA